MKKETIEEVAERFIKKQNFNSLEIDDKIFEAILFGAEWQQKQTKNKLKLAEHFYEVVYKEKERMYSEEEVVYALLLCSNKKFKNSLEVKEWFEKFKKQT